MTATLQFFRLARAAAAIAALSASIFIAMPPSAHAAEGIALFPRSLSNQFKDNVQNTVYFEQGSAYLTAEARTVLRAQAAWISKHLGVSIRVTSYTKGLGKSKDTGELGNRRAMAVSKYLMAQGISKDLIKINVRADWVPVEIAEITALNSGQRVETKVLGLSAPNVGTDTFVGKIVSWVPMAPGDSVETVDGTTSVASAGGSGAQDGTGSGSTTTTDPTPPSTVDPTTGPGKSGSNGKGNPGGKDKPKPGRSKNGNAGGKGKDKPARSPTF